MPFAAADVEAVISATNRSDLLAINSLAQKFAEASHDSGRSSQSRSTSALSSDQEYEAAAWRAVDALQAQTPSLTRKMEPRTESTASSEVDCNLTAESVELNQLLSASGNPDVDFERVSTPEEAVLATLKAVTLHELGHILGLRHNFVASTLAGQIEGLPFKTLERTHSVMDYNDIAIDIDSGIPLSKLEAAGEIGVGVWDWIAIWSLYGKGEWKPEWAVKAPVKFCTDNNRTSFDNCQPHDFGSDYGQFALYKANRLLYRLRANGLAFGTNLPGQLQEEVAHLWAAWSVAANSLSTRTGRPAKLGQAIDRLDLLSNGNLVPVEGYAVDDYLRSFEERYGFKPLGLLQMLALTEDFYKNPEAMLRKWDKVIGEHAVVSAMTPGLMAGLFTVAINSGAGSDARYFPLVTDLSLASRSMPLASSVIDALARKVIIPAGEAAEFSLLAPGSLETLNVKLETPFLNHIANIRFHAVEAGPEDPAGRKIFRKNGESRIDDLKSVLGAISLLSAGGADTLSVKRLIADRQSLFCLLNTGSGDCPKPQEGEGRFDMSPESKHAGVLLLDAYDDAIARARGPSPAVIALSQQEAASRIAD